MRKYIPVFVLLLVSAYLFGQEEHLSNLNCNPSLYYATKKYQPSGHHLKYLVDKGNTKVTGTTLQLPFIDDFSQVRTRHYKWVENHITKTFYNAKGACLDPEGFNTIHIRVMDSVSWNYTMDTLGNLDSTPKPRLWYVQFRGSNSGCLDNLYDTVYYYPEYYRYTFDTTKYHNKIDSVLVTDRPSDSIAYLPVLYFADGDTGTLWFDNYAYVNNTYPLAPPTIGVATLDGLNEYGLAYDNSTLSTYGQADYLTSNPIDLSGLGAGDSVYLSFFYEGGGLGDYPDVDDSLIVDFKEVGGIWDEMWAIPGFVEPDSVPNYFQQVLLVIPDRPSFATFFHNQFQFRFRNYSALYGNLDNWHIDYVKLAKNRFAQDTIIRDIAFVYPFPNILKNYTEMPADQVIFPDDLRGDTTLLVHDLIPGDVSSTNYESESHFVFPGTGSIQMPSPTTFLAGQDSLLGFNPNAEYTITNPAVDSFVISSKIFLDASLNTGLALNDTLYKTQVFSHVLAYDDGSAEQAYGISGVGTKKFAYEFDLNHPDTVTGFQVMYAQVTENVHDLIFNFSFWDTLKMNDYNYVDTPRYTLDNQRPIYIDSTNGFATYKLDTALVFQNKIYIGWQQFDDRNLQIGYDLNSTLGRPHMYFFHGARWTPSTISPDGSPMIRLILMSNFWGTTSGITELTKEYGTLQLYPNPSGGIINVTGERLNDSYEITISNAMGQEVWHSAQVINNFDISNLPSGIYLITSRDTETGKTYRNKIIKTGGQ